MANVDVSSGSLAEVRQRFLTADRRDEIVAMTRQLVAVPSPNPPLATGEVAEAAEAIIRNVIPDAEVTLHRASDEVVNLVARLPGRGPGRRLAFSGHLDTYPIGEDLGWTVDPLKGAVKDGRIYGRGVSDMKGGIAASITAMALLAEHRDAWAGEAVLLLGGDEESMGTLGAQFLIDTVPEARAEAIIIGDVGSPQVVRYGEKGFLWVTVEAEGAVAHGAHVHRGINAIDRLRQAMDVMSGLRDIAVQMPEAVVSSIAAAKPISEPLSGAGEAEVLSAITVNLGQIQGGVSPNLIPSRAHVAADIRLPVGVSAGEIEERLRDSLARIEGVRLVVDRRIEPSYTDPNHEIIVGTAAAATVVLGTAPAVNMRVGASDARVFRKANIPTVVYGPTPFNMGAADEYVLVDELADVMRVHALSGLEFLSR